MAKERFKFYLAMDQEAPKDEKRFQESMTAAYVNGIEPIEYREEMVLDTRDNNKVVQTIILLKCTERWNGASKRFFKKAKFEYLDRKVDGLPVFG